MSTVLQFVKVGDVSEKYAYLEIFVKGDISPFMEIAVTDSKGLCFRIYSAKQSTDLQLDDLNEIMKTAKKFRLEVIKDEETYEKMFGADER